MRPVSDPWHGTALIRGQRRCDTRPHFGISGGRAVYCANHKKQGMVHLLKESTALERGGASR